MRNRVPTMDVISAALFGSLIQGAPLQSAPDRSCGEGANRRFSFNPGSLF
ncbi:MAG: hypothetical protein K0A89_04335 [ANME-2 cluster archaeon]|nr:hypothetical protein [ANME-2 cluster archaeon]